MKIIKYIIFIFIFFKAISILWSQTDRWDFSKTYAVIVGVLKWQDRSLSTYSQENRKDKELYELLISKGVLKENIIILLDEKATLISIENSIKKIISKTNSDSTFLFYYDGHGLKKNNTTYFANYDINTSDPEKKGLSLNRIKKSLSGFKGSQLILMGDCCYSGSMKEVGEYFGSKGVKTFVLTSADSSNTSTGNWTFTQSVIDSLNGNPLADRDKNNVITLNELAAEVYDAMKFREKQLFGYSKWNINDDFVITNVELENKISNISDNLIGKYVSAPYKNTILTARVIETNDQTAKCEFYFYSRKEFAFISKNKLKEIVFSIHPAGNVNVIWGNKIYPAKILKVNREFHYITYPGWSREWDEWIMDNRIIAHPTTVKIFWKGSWYTGVILKKEGLKFYIHYLGYDHSWDEWVTKDRLKF